MPDIITIKDQAIGLDEHKIVNIGIAKLPSYTNIDLQVNVYRGKKDGPVLLVTGGLHGDEINGIEIIRELINSKKIHPEVGTVIAIPIVNVYGFILNERGLPDGKDINRSFPGVKGGSLARLIAYTLMNEILPKVDYGIDLHTGGASRSNYPQIRCSFDIPEALELAKAFSAPITLHSKLIDKSFRSAAHKKGKEIIVYETGESLRLDKNGIQIGIEGTLRLMQHLGMINQVSKAQETEIFKKSSWIRAKNSGLFNPEFKLGARVGKKSILGYINDPYGGLKTKVVFSGEGVIIGQNNKPIVHKGDALIHIAYN
ncbi:MAG: succinylglutamate desuccinylase/aspartoacylase family protein [Balneolaceae bacterium]|nr:succinylglutamate desuccinylase/aspartoacylase family protein [Balneolaceae bacterium]MBO6546208.1 succinylglutamate desuccinylase/aspartoacylase family protein [Balneolaceae bacterium]MBO6648567.1 succinylglutamate desuccinylase/aspartoacylase family protein [Balneolaceae bacterium]